MSEPQAQAGEAPLEGELALMVPCDHCAQIWLIRTSLAGKSASCRGCGGKVRVPSASLFKQEWNKERLPTPGCFATLGRKGLLSSGTTQTQILNLNLKGFQACTDDDGLKGHFSLDQLTHRVDEKILFFQEKLQIPCKTVWKRQATPTRWKIGFAFDDLRFRQKKGLERFLKKMRGRVYPSLAAPDEPDVGAEESGADE